MIISINEVNLKKLSSNLLCKIVNVCDLILTFSKSKKISNSFLLLGLLIYLFQQSVML